MSVSQKDIDLNKILDKAAGKTAGEPKKKNAETKTAPELASILDAAATGALKKKDVGTHSVKPSSHLPDGAAAVPGTTSTTPTTVKWEDNPLNPVKAANDFEAKRDKTPEILFKEGDNEKLTGLLNKHGVIPTPTVTQPLSAILPISSTPTIGYQPVEQPIVKTPVQASYESASRLVDDLQAQIKQSKDARLEKREPKSNAEKELENDLQEAQNLKRKAATELVVNGDKEIEVNTRTNEIGNSFNQFMSDIITLNQPIKGGKQFNVKETEDKLKKQPTQFLTGVNMLKLTDPAQYERITEAIAKGLPISASQTANITALGLNIEEAKLKRDILKSPVTPQDRQAFDEIGKTLNTIKPDIDKYDEMLKAKLPLSQEQIADYKTKVQQYNDLIKSSKPLIDKVNAVDGLFAKKAQQLLETKKRNLIDNPEVLRGFIADGVATKLDEIGKIKQIPGNNSTKLVSDFMFGHTWNYSPEQIKWASEQYLKENGIDPSIPQAQAAIKFLQDNEGVMIGENSIAKAGGFRELGEGLIEPIVGTAKTFKDWSRPSNTTYAESQSAGNVDIAKKRLASEDTGVRSVVNDVLKGTGQFATQAAMMYAVSGGIGALSEGLLGKNGVNLLADAKAANIKPVFAFDDATANLAAGKFLDGIKNPLSVFTTSYAMAYDGNLKAALSYTSDNALAKRAASFNAAMEGATELFLSPLEIAEGIIHKFSKNQTKDILKILSDKSLKDDPSALKQYVGKFVKGVLGTAKVATAEIGEELVTQISDYVTNMYLNPESDSFKNRNLNQELMTTAYQTGLSMAVPALMNGIGAARANTFSKGSLLVAAQNRQAMVDNLNKSVAEGSIDQKYADQQIQLINTAAVANAQVPKKANGSDLNTNEKANYVWSRTTEAYMEKQMASTTDAAQKEIWKDKILKQQEYRKGILGLTEEQPEVPEYTIDDRPVSKEELLQTVEAEPGKHNFVATGDEEAQAAIRKIGGIDDKEDEVIPEPEAQLPSDKELVKSVEEKGIPGYEKTSITELKEQALQAPASFKNQFGDEELTVNLIAKNTPEQIENAIKYQEERLTNDPNMDEVSMTGIDQHIQLLEKGLEKNKQFAELEEKAAELKKEGKPLSKLETLKAKKKLAEVEVPGETVDEKLKHIADKPEGFAPELVALADKRFPKETKKSLEEEYNSKTVEELVFLKKELYPNPDIETPMSAEEKLLDKVISAKFSEKNQEILNKRKEKKQQLGKDVVVDEGVGGKNKIELVNNPDFTMEGSVAFGTIGTHGFDIIKDGKKVGHIVYDKPNEGEVRLVDISVDKKREGIATEAVKQILNKEGAVLIEGVAESKEGKKFREAFQEQSLSTKPEIHKQNIHDKFRKVFEEKGVPKEQVDGAIALMEARAKSWASEEKGRNADDWYSRIADVKSGEFQAETPKQYQLPDGRKVMGMNQPEVTNGFYSPLEKVVTDSKADKLPAKQWIEKYANSEEAKWTGLKDWLAQQQGAVSKADIQQYLKDNRIQVVEVVKGEVSNFTKDDIADVKINQHGAGNWVVKTKEDGTVEFPLDKADDKAEAIEYALEQLNYDNKSKRESKPKFQQYQTEGEKSNYKEVLVTMPDKKQLTYNQWFNKWDGLLKELYEKYNVSRVNPAKDLNEKMSPVDKKRFDILKSQEPSKEKTDFRSSHFDEPNILVHLRMNTRTDADGKKVLFLEEVQSDWGQKGKKEGFNIDDKWEMKPSEMHDGDYAVYKNDKLFQDGMSKQYAQEYVDRHIQYSEKNIPSAPFVTETPQWTKLGLKVALKEAVKQGVDKIAWTTGEQQNERYDLSKQVDWINAEKTNKGDYKIEVGHKDNRPMETQYLKENELEANLGKELATKIVNDGGGMYKGLDLKVGGKGMKGFYGSPTENNLGIVGNVAKSLFKQEPKTVTIKGGKGSIDATSVDAIWVEDNGKVLPENKREDYKFNDNEFVFTIDNNVAYRLYDKNDIRDAKNREVYTIPRGEIFIQHSIDITPELKKQATEGQPLFQKNEGKAKGAVETLADGKKVIHALDSPDFSTMVHEIGHIFEGDLTASEQKIVKDFGGSEPFARGFEKYLRDGKAPTPELKTLFDKFKQWLTDIYKTLKGSPIEKQVTPEIKQIFDRLLTEQKESTKPEIKNEEAKAIEVPKPTEKESVAELKPDKEVQPAEEVEPKIKDVNLDKEIGLLSADFLEINKPEVTQGSQRIKIVDVPLSSITTDTGTFQNRETEFSQESVDKILKAVQDDTFNWTEFDPITLWKDNGQLKVLSGHSRFEAFKQLVKRGYAGFDTIPAEIFEGSKEQAIAIALRSNTLSTKETPIERANFYREARLAGTASRSLLNEAREYEGRNAPTIIALSYLNPNGKAIAFLKALGQEGDTKSKANSLQMARWTGEVRQQFPQLTNEHENEIFDWLKDGAYNKIKNLPEISARINNVVSAFDFDSESALNLAHKGTKTYVDEQYEQQLADKEKQIKDQQKLIADKSTKYNEAKLSPQEVAEKLVPDNAILSRLQQDYIKLKEKKGAISEANKGILSLFDNIQTEIDNGNITEQQVEAFINNTGQIEEDDTIIEDIERNAESPDDAGTAIQEGNELIAGEDVNAKRIERAEEKLATKIKTLEKEKTSRLNEITKPVIDMNTMLITDLFTLAGTTESNRQEYDEIKNQLFGLKNLIDCLFS